MTVDLAQRRRAVARWHRRFAVFIALWLVVLAASGLLINHANDWGLDRSPLPASLQRWVYGLESNNEDFCSAAPVAGMDCSGVFARLPLPSGALLLDKNSLFLLDVSGQLVEKLAASQLGLGHLQGGFSEGSRIYLRDEQTTVMTDSELMSHTILDSQDAKALDGRDWHLHDQASEAIHWERFLLDLHAARFLGPLAKAFNDLLAVLILVLAISGVWLYRLKRKANGSGQNGRGQ